MRLVSTAAAQPGQRSLLAAGSPLGRALLRGTQASCGCACSRLLCARRQQGTPLDLRGPALRLRAAPSWRFREFLDMSLRLQRRCPRQGAICCSSLFSRLACPACTWYADPAKVYMQRCTSCMADWCTSAMRLHQSKAGGGAEGRTLHGAYSGVHPFAAPRTVAMHSPTPWACRGGQLAGQAAAAPVAASWHQACCACTVLTDDACVQGRCHRHGARWHYQRRSACSTKHDHRADPLQCPAAPLASSAL